MTLLRSRTCVFLAIALVACAVSLPSFARAADTASAPPATTPATQGAGSAGGGGGTNTTPSPQTSTAGLTNNQPASPKGTGAIDDSAYNYVMIRVMGLFAWLLGAATLALDFSVYYGVATMGTVINGASGSGGLAAIGVTWTILRNIGNILLIFGFIFAGIATIINLTIYGFGSKMLPMLLVAAVFINFSLFISEAVIDVGNLFATEIFVQINGGSLPGPAQFNGSDPVVNEGISNRIMSVIGLQSLYNVSSNATTIKANQTILQSGAWYVGFMAIILFLIAAFVMFSLALIIIARFVALIFLIIIAPVGFAGLAVPKLSGTAKLWWSQLFEQTITAPVLLLLLYIALAIITDANFLLGFGVSGGGSTGSANTAADAWKGFLQSGSGVGQFASIFFSFLVAMGLLLAVTVVAKRMSAFGAGWATRLAGRASFGAVAYAGSVAGRATLGTAGNLLASKRMQGFATPRKTDSTARRYARYALRPLVFGGKGLRLGTYDIRNAKIPGGKTALGAAATSALAGMGVATTMGRGATLTPQQMYAAGYGYQPTKRYFQESEAHYQQAAREADFREAQREMIYAQRDLDAGRITPAQYAARVAPSQDVITKGIARMSAKQLEELSGIKQGIDALVTNLSPQQFEALMKSDKLTGTEKGNIQGARYRRLSTALAASDVAGVDTALRSYSKGEIESMPSDMLMHRNAAGQQLVLERLSGKQRDFIADSTDRTTLEKDAVRGASPVGRVEALYRARGAAAAAASPDFARLTVPDIAKLDKAILLDPTVAATFRAATLVKLQEEHKFTPAEMQRVGIIIRTSPTADRKTVDYITTGPGAAVW